MEKYFQIASARGWGLFEIVEYSEEKQTAIVRIYSSYTEEYEGKTGRGECIIWQGALAGILQYQIYGKLSPRKMTCIEVKCIVKGDEYCEFIIKPIQPRAQQ